MRRKAQEEYTWFDRLRHRVFWLVAAPILIAMFPLAVILGEEEWACFKDLIIDAWEAFWKGSF